MDQEQINFFAISPVKYLNQNSDTLVGTLDYGKVRIATATMGFKHRVVDHAVVLAALATPNFLLKIMPHVDASLTVGEVVHDYLVDK